jgi:hypothetical protein
VIQVRKFSRKQGFTPQTPADTPQTTAASEEPKNQRTDIPYSATPPSLFGDSQNGVADSKDQYQLEFESQIKPAYPKRDGDQRWLQAASCYRAARKAGESLAQILAGVQRYCRWVEAKGLIGTDKVKQAASFLGREKCWREPWDIATAERQQQHLAGGFVG